MSQNPDSLIDYIVMYKLKHFKNFEYDENSVLINNTGIRFNFDFVEFVIDNKYFPDLYKDKDIFKKRLIYLSLLTEIEKKYLLEYILKYVRLFK